MINLNSKIWGPPGWFFIESIAISLPDNITFILQNEIKHFFIALSSLLPCEKCRYHFSDYIKKTDMMNIDFSTKKNVLKWVNNLHNQIRKRNNSSTISLEKTLKYYDSQYNIQSKTSYIDIFYIMIFTFIVFLLIKFLYFPKPPNTELDPSNFSS
jgi:hypothetical protein